MNSYFSNMNSTQIFQLALSLQKPWKVIKSEMLETEKGKELHLYIHYEKGFFVDDNGKSNIHDLQEKQWQHLNFFEHKCFLHCKVPRVKDELGKVKLVEVPWARKGSGFTLLFEAFSMCLIEQEMPVNKVGKVLRIYPNRVWTIFNYYLSIAYSNADHASIKVLGIDETSTVRGHNYVTISVDMEENRVVHAVKGKDASTIEKTAKYLESKGCKREQIEKVCIDLSPSFISGVSSNFSKAAVIFDRFHVKKMLNDAMNDVRKNELKLHHQLKRHKYLFLKENRNLKEKQRQERNDLIELLPVIGKAYKLKIMFDDFWEMKDEQEAASFLAFWCDLAEEAKIFAFQKFANSIKSHWSGIVNYTKHKITNGILEGINSKIQLAKRRARGYANIQNFINMIYFLNGKLKFDYPLYLT